ncbi:MAG: MerR family transcriptional regulator [Planctomycetota bacterium]
MQPDVTSHLVQIPVKLYRIGELVRYTPFSRQTIHNYTIMGLIRESQWTEGGHRLYDESVFERLSKIIELRKTKTLSEIRRILNTETVTSRGKETSPQTENN